MALFNNNQQKKLGKYQIGELIGRGAVGQVYKGLNYETGMLVAIKQVSLQNIKNDELQSIQSEINLLKKLKHENIVKYIDSIYSDSHLNIILEYIESGSLSQIIKKFGSFPESLVSIYIKQVLTGLEYLHGQGVVHRDIKGANILTTKEGIVKLADFGVATKLSEAEKSLSFVGTPYWMAPEMIEMKGHISTACDLWSVGCTVIELLTGNPPYHEMNQYTAMFRIVQDDLPPIPAGISERCKDFLLKCFQKEPTLRLDATTLLKHPWIKDSDSEVYEIINSPDNALPEEVTNTIRLHIDKQQLSEGEQIRITDTYKLDENHKEQLYILNNQQIINLQAELLQPSKYCSNDNLTSNNSNNNNNKIHDFSMLLQSSARTQDINIKHIPKSTIYESDSDFINNKISLDSLRQHSTKPNHNTNQYQRSQQSPIQDQQQQQQQQQIQPIVSNFSLQEDNSILSYDNINDTLTGIGIHLDSLKQLKYRQSHTNDISQQQQDSTLQLSLQQQQSQQQQQQQGNFQLSKKDQKYSRELANIIRLIQEQDNQEGIIQSLMRLIEILKQTPRTRILLVKNYGLTVFLDILDQFPGIYDIIHPVLQVINQIIEGDQKIQEICSFFGIIPVIMKYVGSEYPKDIRIEAAYFIGQISSNSVTNLQLFLSCGGHKTLVELLDYNYEENKYLIQLAIDCLLFIFDVKILSNYHLCKIFGRTTILQRLALIIDNFANDSDDTLIEKYLIKSLDILTHFAKCEDTKICQSLCDDAILYNILPLLEIFENNQLLLTKLIRIIKFLSTDTNMLDKLEAIGIIPTLLKLINNNKNEDLILDLLKILLFLSKVNATRQEAIASLGGVSLLLNLSKNDNKHIRTHSFSILCNLVQTSQFTRDKLWECGGPKIYIDFLEDEINQAKVLDTLSKWIIIEGKKVENYLGNEECLKKLIQLFKYSNKTAFQQIISIYLQIISQSDILAAKFCQSTSFIQELAERLGVDFQEKKTRVSNYIQDSIKSTSKRLECINPSALVRKEALDILWHLCLRHTNPRALLDTHNLYPIIMQILHIAQNDDMVILEEIATQILQIYSQDCNGNHNSKLNDNFSVDIKNNHSHKLRYKTSNSRDEIRRKDDNVEQKYFSKSNEFL